MALFHMNRAYNWTPNMFSVSGSFVVPSTATTVNKQVLPALLTMGAVGTSQLTPTATLYPQGALAAVFCTPNGSSAGAAGNTSTLPAGIGAGAQTAGSEYLLDLSAFSADIISAQATYAPNARGGTTFDCIVSAIDNVNKLVYLQVLNGTTGAVAAATTGALITFQVDMKDAFAP